MRRSSSTFRGLPSGSRGKWKLIASSLAFFMALVLSPAEIDGLCVCVGSASIAELARPTGRGSSIQPVAHSFSTGGPESHEVTGESLTRLQTYLYAFHPEYRERGGGLVLPPLSNGRFS